MQKIDKILVGTHNKGKFIEMSDLLPKKIEKISPIDLDIKSPIENGKTFEENSEIKAEFFCKNSNLVTLSDDSGLEVDALNGEPGIFSSRFAEDLGGFENAMKKILERIKKINKGSKAQFISSLTIQWPDGKKITETGVIKGSLTDIRGENGFGYDPIFVPEGYSKTFAEMNYKEKLKIDHRQIAYKKLYEKIKVYF
ncbi:RdgB/HAM1 family non-canonical purine NTP pyrophosphatase [Pelagibacteraceae bacterium]|nr:RdgB/HAM1 family non-canonical purine NTP pyrophosphatase [Pelagibacteraceae bacterium]